MARRYKTLTLRAECATVWNMQSNGLQEILMDENGKTRQCEVYDCFIGFFQLAMSSTQWPEQ